ncbi:zinc finger protein ZAT12-like [Carica papaya]|uniref:zinc finger protein ZAT12-like n=1 Tax=Carica papaya TaxID=3649 RepID=UPI000B8C74D1|nr:zinc finger protein ZAT12-like [Carica papaya]
MKRSNLQGGVGELDSLTMANCLMLLSQGGNFYEGSTMAAANPIRVFECKTCNRQFPSFQALGGHRASHKKPRLMPTTTEEGSGNTADKDSTASLSSSSSPAKPKTHECSICGLEFAIGQALGGHMRRHRGGGSSRNETTIAGHHHHHQPLPAPRDFDNKTLVKRSNSRRVLWLDLNLTPMENDLELFKLQKTSPMVDCFF